MYPLHHNDVLGMYPLYVVTSFVGNSPSRSQCTVGKISHFTDMKKNCLRWDSNPGPRGPIEKSRVRVLVSANFFSCRKNCDCVLLCNVPYIHYKAFEMYWTCIMVHLMYYDQNKNKKLGKR